MFIILTSQIHTFYSHQEATVRSLCVNLTALTDILAFIYVAPFYNTENNLEISESHFFNFTLACSAQTKPVQTCVRDYCPLGTPNCVKVSTI